MPQRKSTVHSSTSLLLFLIKILLITANIASHWKAPCLDFHKKVIELWLNISNCVSKLLLIQHHFFALLFSSAISHILLNFFVVSIFSHCKEQRRVPVAPGMGSCAQLTSLRSTGHHSEGTEAPRRSITSFSLQQGVPFETGKFQNISKYKF